jgi:hypothetical protein
MDPVIPDLPFAASMFAGMLICLEIGRRLGMRSLAKILRGPCPGSALCKVQSSACTDC